MGKRSYLVIALVAFVLIAVAIHFFGGSLWRSLASLHGPR